LLEFLVECCEPVGRKDFAAYRDCCLMGKDTGREQEFPVRTQIKSLSIELQQFSLDSSMHQLLSNCPESTIEDKPFLL
jgi:hypothetical protein